MTSGHSPVSPSPSRPRPAGWHSSGRRVAVAAVIGLVATVTVGAWLGWIYAPSVGWVVASVVFLVWTWRLVGRMDQAATAEHATVEDPTTRASHLVLLTASAASLVAVGFLLVRASAHHGGTRLLSGTLGVACVVTSWVVVHTLFMLRYARMYYGRTPGGIDFQGTPHDGPAYPDFAYLAFTLGMTYQVSDTAITDSRIRAVVLQHTLISYVYGALLLGTAVNLVAGLASQSGG